MRRFFEKLQTGGGIYRIIRYVIIGGLTTLVSVYSFWLFERILGLPTTGANALSIILAVAFAYVLNKIIVFRTHCPTRKELFREAATFVSARAVTMVMEFLGMLLLHNKLKIDSMISKGIVTIAVIIANYVLSRVYVFRGLPPD